MKIAVLCGSARPNANSLAYSKAFKEGAESAGHEVELINVGQMQNVITRFYSKGFPDAKKVAMILSSGSPGVYDAIMSQYKSILNYAKREDAGVLMFNGKQPDEYLDEVRLFAAGL